MNTLSACKRRLVYTAVTASSPSTLRDNLLPISKDAEDPFCDFICFTNISGWRAPSGWSTKLVSISKVDSISMPNYQKSRLLARSVKLMIHEHIDLSPYTTVMWVDANVNFLQPPSRMIDDLNLKFRKDSRLPLMLTFRHHERCTVAKEITFILKHRPEELHNLSLLEAVMREAKFTDESLLFETCILIREVSPQTEDLCKDWWGLMSQIGLRDQIVLPLIVSRHKKTVNFNGISYKWRADAKFDTHLKWPKAPWVERRPHNKLK